MTSVMDGSFVHLHVHTKHSIGEGTLYIHANPKKEPNRVTIAKLCKQYGMPACAITDTNMMSGTAEASDTLPNAGIQPIIGLAASFNHHATADPKILRIGQLSRIILLAQNQTGYENLCRLNSMMYLRTACPHLGAFINWEELAANNEGLICLSGGHNGPLGMAILESQDGLADEYASRFIKIFGDRFYMEIQRHGMESEIKTEPEFLRIAATMNIPLVATNDVCFAGLENYEPTDALGCVLQQTKVIDPDRPRKNSQQYFKSSAEMRELFSDLAEACDNTLIIAQRCAFIVNTKSPPLLPKFGNDFDEECRMLREMTMSRLKDRLEKSKITDTKPYYDQADFELEVIIKMGFPGYFLIVADYCDWCRNNDILVGPGRGSGAGSVVSWSLGITNVNPMEYGLLFERFLNPDRISMPDFDVDFEPAGLPRLMNYLIDKYGADRVCHIITFGSLQARGAIRDIGRVYGIPYSKTDRFAKLIPADAKKISDAVSQSDEIQNLLDDDQDLKKVIDVSIEVEGAYRNLGQHACGIVIGDRPTIQIAPVYSADPNDMPSCQFDGHYLESVGLIKFDFLGLETLTVLKYAQQLLRKTRGLNLNLDSIPLDDKKTMELWRSGRTLGIFQFEANHVPPILKKMQPDSFLNIVALNALNRPGPLAYIPQYIARMHGEEPVQYPHQKAEEILKETYGIIVYQEQVMQLSRALAGFTRGESDTLRKGMGKKIKEVMDKMRVKFIEGCEKEKTLSPEGAEAMYQQFIKFAEYAFNKSHSVAYAIIAAQCAYIKANYPAEFFAAALSSEMNNSEKMALYLEDAKNNFGLTVVPPDINISESLFTVQDGKVIFGLAAIKGVGVSATDAIIAERNANGKFKNLTDFAKRTAGLVNKRILEAFAKVGVLDSLEPNRAKIFMNADMILSYAIKQKQDAGLLNLFATTIEDDVSENRLHKNLPNTPSWSFGERLSNELSALGFYISAHPLDQYKNMIARIGLTTSETLSRRGDRMPVQIAVNVNSFSRRRTKTGKDMITLNAADSFGTVDAVAFGDSAAEFAQILNNDSVVLISGKTSQRDESTSIFIDSIIPLSAWVARNAKKLTLEIHDQTVLPDVKNALDTLGHGSTRIALNIHGEKLATLLLPRAVMLSPTTMEDMQKLGVKYKVE